MRLAEIKDGVVVNVVEVDPATIPDWAVDWPDAGQAGPGWTYDGNAFSPPLEPPAPIPEIISPLQARAALMEAGKLSEVETVIAGAPAIVQVAWEYAVEIRRNSPTIEAMAAALDWGDAEVDALFVAAAAIEF